jgi:hypothetical protein
VIDPTMLARLIVEDREVALAAVRAGGTLAALHALPAATAAIYPRERLRMARRAAAAVVALVEAARVAGNQARGATR